MKKVLLLMVAALMVSSVAMADHIGVYADASGTSCELAAGFTSTATVVYKYAAGSTGARFKVQAPAGSSIFGFTTPYVVIGTITNDLSIAFGVCIPGSFPLGTLAAIWAVGQGDVLAADGFPNMIFTDCNFGEYPMTGGRFYVGGTGDCLEPNATESSTWGQVKALYR